MALWMTERVKKMIENYLKNPPEKISIDADSSYPPLIREPSLVELAQRYPASKYIEEEMGQNKADLGEEHSS